MVIRKIIFFLLLAMVFSVTMQSQRVDNLQRSGEDITNQEYFYVFTEATKYYLFGNYVQAVRLFTECLKLKPESSAVHFQLSKIFLNSGNIALAREHAKKANKYAANNKWYLQELGDIYQMEQKYDSAILIYKNLLALDKDNVNILFGIASLYEKLTKYDEALPYLDTIDDKIGLSKEVSLNRYRLYEAKSLPKDAIVQLKIAETLSDGEYSITGMIAEFYRHQNLPDSAVKYYAEIYPKYKFDPTVAFSYADFLIELGKADSARDILLTIMNDSSVDNLVKAGYFYNILQNENEFNSVRHLLDTIADVYHTYHNEDIRSLSIYADVQLRLRNFQKSAVALESIVNRDPDNYAAIEQLIYTLNILGKTDSVVYFAEKANLLFKDKPIPYLFNGSANFQLKQYEKCLGALNKGLQLAKEDALKIEFYSLLAECYQGMNQFDNSERAFDAALAIDKEHVGIKNNYAYYLSLRRKNLDQAEKMSFSTIKSEPENSTYLDTYAWVLYNMGKYVKARKYILEAIKNGGESNKEILMHSADIHVKLKEYDEALMYLQRALLLADSSEKDEIAVKIQALNKQISK